MIHTGLTFPDVALILGICAFVSYLGHLVVIRNGVEKKLEVIWGALGERVNRDEVITRLKFLHERDDANEEELEAAKKLLNEAWEARFQHHIEAMHMHEIPADLQAQLKARLEEHVILAQELSTLKEALAGFSLGHSMGLGRELEQR